MACDIPEARKPELLQVVRQHRVRRMTGLSCSSDTAWSLQLLRLAAPHLEELQVCNVQRLHLLAVLDMPRLRRLDVTGDAMTDQSAYPAAPPLLPNHRAVIEGLRGLRWLRVSGLPRETTLSLIRANAGTLEQLEVAVGTPGGGEWPKGCDDLHAALRGSGLASLRRLVLSRPHGHDPTTDRLACAVQIQALRRELRRVQVQCGACRGAALARLQRRRLLAAPARLNPGVETK